MARVLYISIVMALIMREISSKGCQLCRDSFLSGELKLCCKGSEVELPKDINATTTIISIYDGYFTGIPFENFTFPPTLTQLIIHRSKFEKVGRFKRHENFKSISIYDGDFKGTPFENFTFPPMLTQVIIHGSKFEKVGRLKRHENLKSIDLERNGISYVEDGAFDDIPSLQILTLQNQKLTTIPNFNRPARNLKNLFLDRNKIKEVKPGQLDSFPVLEELSLKENSFTVIPDKFLTLPRLTKLFFNGVPITTIEANAFEYLTKIDELNLDGSNIEDLPTKGLKNLVKLSLRGNLRLRSLPSDLKKIREIVVADEKSFLCCRFHLERVEHGGPRTDPGLTDVWQSTMATREVLSTPSTNDTILSNISTTNSSLHAIPPGFGRKKRRVHIKTQTAPPFDASKPFNPPHSDPVQCSPEPTAFQPCENIMGATWLTAASFVVSSFALCGNFVVLVVFVCLARHYNVSRFLVTNLAIADLCMGVYLLTLVVESVTTSGEYYNHVERLQYGLSCKVLGFLAIFSSELSVFALTFITIERYLTIVYALYPKRRLGMRHAVIVMGIAWLVAITIALLPILSVSSYSKVAICLPFDIENGGKWYLLFVFIFNGISFVFITILYILIYRSVFVSANSSPSRGHDSRVARRMAILVFTDFACFAPIAVTGLSAMYGNSLIGVKESKYLLVFFFPLNSFMNPFLYALITKNFRRDLAALMKNCFVCGGALTEYLTTLPARSVHSNNDHLSRGTRQSIDFNAMDLQAGVVNARGSRDNPVSASFSKSEPNLVKFTNVAIEPSTF